MSQINPSNSPNKPIQQATFNPPGQAEVVKDPNKRTAAFGLHMANALAYALTSQNVSIGMENDEQKQVTLIQALSESFSKAPGLLEVQTAIENLQSSFSQSNFPEVSNWLNIQAESVQQLIASNQGLYNQYQTKMNQFNTYINNNWGELGRHSDFQTYFTYDQYRTYMSGKGNPTCTVPGKYYGQTVGHEMRKNPGCIGNSPGLFWNFNYDQFNKKSSTMFAEATGYYQEWNGNMKISFHSFSSTMSKQSNKLQHQVSEFDMTEQTALQLMRNMSTILTNLSFSAANLPGNG